MPTEWQGMRSPAFVPDQKWSGYTPKHFRIKPLDQPLADSYAENAYVPPIAYGLATVFALGRVYDGAHHFPDVVVGSLLGYCISKSIVKKHPLEDKEKPLALSIVPSKHGASCLFTYKF